MMVDTSAVVAILRNEPEAEKFTNILEAARRSMMVAPNYLELCMVLLGNKEPPALRKVRETLNELGIRVIGFTPEMADVAVSAFERFGKGRGSKANLNFGDCIAYAASKVENAPLLFKGEDFRLTDVECAI
jgi:ribonuclease VapC